MLSEIMPVTFDKIVQSRTYTAIVLKAQGKSFAIYTENSVGKLLQLYLSDTNTQRPLTHDLFDQIFDGFEIKVKHVVINDVKDNIFFAKLFLEQQNGDLLHIVEIDGRPSDCLTLALMNDAPVYCTREVFEKTLPLDEEYGED